LVGSNLTGGGAALSDPVLLDDAPTYRSGRNNVNVLPTSGRLRN
jgi:hypothetical protein